MKYDPPLRIRNSTFSFVFDNLLEAFNFTVREDTPLNQDVAVDPEMLGKVFESIILHAEAADPDAVAPDKRKATGSYYTPRIVVHFICRETLCQYLLSRLPPAQDWNRRLRAVMDIVAFDGLDVEELARLKTLLIPAEGKLLAELIKSLRCCDPAVGSGAFPVGLLQELLNFRRIVEAVANGYVDPVRRHGNQWIHDTKAQIVESSLYGVDIQQQAIEICRLRLWLSLIVDYDLGCDALTAARPRFLEAIRDISQLPNLETNFRRGDSLLDMISGVPLRVDSGVVSAYREDVTEIQRLGHALHNAKSADKKKKFRVDILRHRLDLTHRVLDDERKQIVDRLTNQTLTFLDAFGFDEDASEAENRRRLEAELKQLEKALKKLTFDHRELEKLAASLGANDFYPRLRRIEGADFDSPFNFVWQIDFAEIFHSKLEACRNDEHAKRRLGGFDIVVGNPPFVTARNPTKRELYAKRWFRVCFKNYQLVCPFFDLSFGLLRPGGQLGFIVSNAFAKREFGQPLVEDFFPTVDLQKIVDCSGLLFPGHGTPTCIVFGANHPPDKQKPVHVAATLPGGGDLRTPPEESPLWHTLVQHHNEESYQDSRVRVSSRQRGELAKWPWTFDESNEPTKIKMEEASSVTLKSFIDEPVGHVAITRTDDVFILPKHLARRCAIEQQHLRALGTGETVRNWSPLSFPLIIFPYLKDLKPLDPEKSPNCIKYLKPFRDVLENVVMHGSVRKKETSVRWFEYSRLARPKFRVLRSIVFPEIATHNHALVDEGSSLFHQTIPVIKLSAIAPLKDHHLLAGLLNSGAVLFWLKQVCFNKGAGEDEHRDRFVYAGGKIEQVPVPVQVNQALRGTGNALSERLMGLARLCWDRGRRLPTLALAKAFEKEGEAYHEWNVSLPGYELPASQFAPTFASTEDLRARLSSVIALRERLRAEMIALQEEMDWLVYEAYDLLSAKRPAVMSIWQSQENSADAVPLQEHERPFRLLAKAQGDFDQASALIPTGEQWSEDRRQLWRVRLEAIRDNEHLRRLEQPVYKRRWDEQWKVGNQWTAGPAAYAQELVDAWSWWLAEKAEWHLEHKVKGGPLGMDAWSAALWADSRVRNAWPVVADAITLVEVHKLEEGGKKPAKMPEADHSAGAFAKCFRAIIADESVPEGIPPAVPWEQLEERMTVPKKARDVRGKLNVPRERFNLRKNNYYVWAGKR